MNHKRIETFHIKATAAFITEDLKYEVTVDHNSNGKMNVTIAEDKSKKVLKKYEDVEYTLGADSKIKITSLENTVNTEFLVRGEECVVFNEFGDALHFTFESNLVKVSGAEARDTSDPKLIVAPMPCTLVKVNFKAGDAVKAGQPIVILEAMKMETVIKAKQDGKVKAIKFKEGEFVHAGKLIVELE